MRRSVEYCAWQSKWWQDQSARRENVPEYLAEGLAAYAKEHSVEEKERSMRWSLKWSAIRDRGRLIRHYLEHPERYANVKIDSQLVVELELEVEGEDGAVVADDDDEDMDVSGM